MRYNVLAMVKKRGKKSGNKVTARRSSAASLGQRALRLRKQRGYSQTELAGRVGIHQVLVSDYELGKLRMHADMVVRFARSLGVTTDELLGVKRSRTNSRSPSLKVRRRLNRIESLPPQQQETILKTIDMLLKATDQK